MLPTTILLLSTLLGPPGPGGAATPEPASTAVPELLPERGPRMRLSRGFAEVVHEAGRTFWRSPVERAYLEPEGHLELGALGDLDLAWSGRGSLHLEGPGALQWTCGAFSGDGSLELFDFRSADLEVRSGGLALDLPGGVRLDMRRGAVQLVSGPVGRYLVHHLGGEAMDLAHPAPGEPRELTLGPGDQLWLDPIALMEVAQEPEPVLAPEPTPAGRPAHQPLPVHAPAMIWPARPMVGDRQGPQEVHLTLRKAAGPVGPAPIPSPFDPDPGPFSSLPAAGGEVEEESQQPAAVGRDFSLSELLNGRVRD